ncbi:MAG: zinc ribbon domain-containing protein [Chloroflexi bacterium]|nr:zinc ribbon domain-containing protein [Chloroflexota bacterium]
MPIYEYECRNHHRFEIKQSYSDKPKAECPTCEAPARRLLTVPSVHYKGSGFYTTDYARASAKPESGEGGKTGEGKKDEAKKSEGKTSEAKAESKNGATAESGSKESGAKEKASSASTATSKADTSKEK